MNLCMFPPAMMCKPHDVPTKTSGGPLGESVSTKTRLVIVLLRPMGTGTTEGDGPDASDSRDESAQVSGTTTGVKKPAIQIPRRRTKPATEATTDSKSAIRFPIGLDFALLSVGFISRLVWQETSQYRTGSMGIVPHTAQDFNKRTLRNWRLRSPQSTNLAITLSTWSDY